MKNRFNTSRLDSKTKSKKQSALGRLFSTLFRWAADHLISSIPVIGPVYKVATLISEIAALDRKEPAHCSA